MSRPSKLGLDYFPLDVHIMENDKIMYASAKYGLEVYAVILRLLCDIYNHCYYIMFDDHYKYVTKMKLGEIDETKLYDIVDFLIEIDFFDSYMYLQYGILTSKSIQETFFIATKKRKERDMDYVYPEFQKYVLVNSEKTIVNSEKTIVNSEKTTDEGEFLQEKTIVNSEKTTDEGEFLQEKMPQSKVKKRKVNESKEDMDEIKRKSLKEKLEEAWPTMSLETKQRITRLNSALVNLGINEPKQRIQIVFASKFGEEGGHIWELISKLRNNYSVKEKGIYILRSLKNDNRDEFLIS